MGCKYVKEFDFGAATKAKGKPFAAGGCATTGYARGGKVSPEAREAVHQHERNMHPDKPLTPMKKGGKVVEKGTGEVYASKAAMMRHEKKETKAQEMKEHAMKKGGKVSPAKKAMIKQEMMVTPTMKKESMMQKRMVKGPAMAAGRDPRMPMIEAPAMKCGGMYKKGK